MKRRTQKPVLAWGVYGKELDDFRYAVGNYDPRKSLSRAYAIRVRIVPVRRKRK